MALWGFFVGLFQGRWYGEGMSEYADTPKKRPTLEAIINEDAGELFTIVEPEMPVRPLRIVPLDTVPRPRTEYSDVQSAAANDTDEL